MNNLIARLCLKANCKICKTYTELYTLTKKINQEGMTSTLNLFLLHNLFEWFDLNTDSKLLKQQIISFSKINLFYHPNNYTML